jgi:hypothetical protein
VKIWLADPATLSAALSEQVQQALSGDGGLSANEQQRLRSLHFDTDR